MFLPKNKYCIFETKKILQEPVPMNGTNPIALTAAVVVSEEIYSCDLCEFTGPQTSVYEHIQAKHDSVTYSCTQCGYSAEKLTHLNLHIETVHNVIRYNCDSCEFSTVQEDYLKTHKRSRHENSSHPCNQCDYAANSPAHLRNHKNAIHKGNTSLYILSTIEHI